MHKLRLLALLGLPFLVMPVGTLQAVPGELIETSPLYQQANPFTQSPQRIVSLNLCTDELLVRLADKKRIAAIMHYSAKPETSTISDQAQDIPKTKGEIEKVLSFEPDLVFAGDFSNVNTVSFLKKLDVPVVVFKVAQDFEDIYINIRRMAKILNEETKGEALIKSMQTRLREIGFVNYKKKPRVLFYQSGGNVPGSDTFQNAIIELAGAKNLAAEMGIRGHAHVNLEDLLFQNVDRLIFLDLHHKRESIGRELLFHPAISKGLPDTKISTLPSRLLNCGSPASVEAVEKLAGQLRE